MLAYDLEKYMNSLKYPIYVQPKLDGYRCVTYCNPITKEIIFYSRSGRPFAFLDHIRRELLKRFPTIRKKFPQPFFLDGELFITDSDIPNPNPNPIYQLRSFLGRKSMTAAELKEHEIIHYHLFDVYFPQQPETSFEMRWKWIMKHIPKSSRSRSIELVPTILVKNQDELLSARDHFLEEGQEGIIVRKPTGVYRVGFKSMNVLRSKKIFEDRFVIQDFREASGKNKGSVVWILQCKKSGRTFQARPMGSIDERRKLFKDGKKWIGREIRVKYFNKNENGCVRRNPVAIVE